MLFSIILSDDNYENVNSKNYNVITTVDAKKGSCTKHLEATGNGVGDTFHLPCTANGLASITSSKVLIYGNPDEDSFSIFSDQPSTLVVYQDKKCTMRKYKTVTRKTFPEISDMSDQECKEALEKIKHTLDKKSKYLEDLDKKADETKTEDTTNVQSSVQSSSKPASETGSKPADDANKQVKPSDSNQVKPSDNKQVKPSDSKQVGPSSVSSDPPKNKESVGTVSEQYTSSSNPVAQPPAETTYYFSSGSTFEDFLKRRSSFYNV